MEGNSTPATTTAPAKTQQTNSAYSPGHKRKSQGKVLMEITAMSGEYPADFIPRMIPAASYARKIISTLVGDKLIKPVLAGGLKGYRLTPKGKRQLLSDNPARFAGFLDGAVETNKIRKGYERRLRLHSLAEVCTLMHNAEVEIFKDVKPRVYLPDAPTVSSQPHDKSPEGGKPPKVNNHSPSENPSQPSVAHEGVNPGQRSPPIISAPCFYTSREQKGQEDNAIRGSRAAGTLLTPEHIYAIYNTGSAVSGWSKNTEQRFKAEVEANISRKLLVSQYEGRAVGGIMIGKDLGTLEKYLAVDEKDKNVYDFLIKVYQPFYYVTNDIHGEAQLKLLCDRDKMAMLRNAMLQRNLPPDKSCPVENDAITADGKPVLFCCHLDFPRLIRFRNSAILHKKAGKVAAFDFQVDMLKNYLKDTAEIVNLNFNNIMARLYQENR